MKNLALITVVALLALMLMLALHLSTNFIDNTPVDNAHISILATNHIKKAHITTLATRGQNPDWATLHQYQHTITKTDFQTLLTQTFTTDNTWQHYITLTPTTAEILTSTNPTITPFTLHFATPQHTTPTPRHWKTTQSLPIPPPEKPLQNLHIAIDPGHIGGQWAKIEERWFQIGDQTPVTEGGMTLQVAKILKPLLQEMGATVTLIRTTTEPITPLRPTDLSSLATKTTPNTPQDLLKFTEKLFYRTAEIHARADLVNNTIKPDLVLCLHFNAAAWGNPEKPTLVEGTHFHILLNGSYTSGEIHLADQRLAMLQKLLQRTHTEEALIAKTIAKTFAKTTKLPPYTYTSGGKNVRPVPGSPYLYTRNLLANRLYQTPVIYMEPYVMNSTHDYHRIQAGHYQGLKEINGEKLPSIFQEYATALAQGLATHYSRKN